jgi:hypothetical protein
MLPNPFSYFVEPVGHYRAHCEDIVGGSEAAGWEVALGKVSESSLETTNVVLERAGWGGEDAWVRIVRSIGLV